MATTTFPGFTGQMFASTAAATTASPASNAIAELRDVTLTVSMEAINTFSKDSSGWDESICGKRSWGGSFTALYRDTTSSTGQALIFNAIDGRTVAGITWRGASSSGVLQYSGGVVVEQYEIGNPENDANVISCNFRGIGAIGRAPSTS